jgi:hypothetical protein
MSGLFDDYMKDILARSGLERQIKFPGSDIFPTLDTMNDIYMGFYRNDIWYAVHVINVSDYEINRLIIKSRDGSVLNDLQITRDGVDNIIHCSRIDKSYVNPLHVRSQEFQGVGCLEIVLQDNPNASIQKISTGLDNSILRLRDIIIGTNESAQMKYISAKGIQEMQKFYTDSEDYRIFSLPMDSICKRVIAGLISSKAK